MDAVEFNKEDEVLFKIIKDPNEIWNFIYPTKIYLKKLHRLDMIVYVQLVCECDWEPEHGL